MGSVALWKKVALIGVAAVVLLLGYRDLKNRRRTPTPAPAANVPESELNWQAEGFDACQVRLEAAQDAPSGLRAVVTGDSGGESWRAKALVAPLRFTKGQKYLVRFRARADRARHLVAITSQAHAPWTLLGLSEEVSLDGEWHSFEHAFTAAEDDSQGRLHFDLGRDGSGWIELADVQLIPAGQPGCAFPFRPQAQPLVELPPVEIPLAGWQLLPAADSASGGQLTAPTPGALRVESGGGQPSGAPRIVASGPMRLDAGVVHALRFNVQSPEVLSFQTAVAAPSGAPMGLATAVRAAPEGEGAYLEFEPPAGDIECRVEFRLPAGFRSVAFSDVQLLRVAQPGGTIAQPTGGQTVAASAAPPPAATPATPAAPALETHGWVLKTGPGWKAEVRPAPSAEGGLRIDIQQPGEPPEWQLQFTKSDLPVEAGRTYRAEFRGRADGPRNVGLALAQGAAPWQGLSVYRVVPLTTEWQSFQFDFTANQADPRARLYFDLGGAASSVELADFKWALLEAGPAPPATAPSAP